jgi:hypothetical protein
MFAVVPALHELEVPLPELKLELVGSQAMSPAAPITGSLVAALESMRSWPGATGTNAANMNTDTAISQRMLDLHPRRPCVLMLKPFLVEFGQ